MTSFETIKNPIFKVHWAGWEADTLSLQRNGWQISAEQDMMRMAIRFAFKHEAYRIYGVSDLVSELDVMGYHGRFNPKMTGTFREFPTVTIRHMASNIDVIVHTNFSSFTPINAVPEFLTQERKHIDDFKLFRPIDKINEIVIARPNAEGLLQEILKLQDPKQAEIREKRRKEFRRFNSIMEGMSFDDASKIALPSSDIVAQIVAVA